MLVIFYGFSRQVKSGAGKGLDFNVTVKIQDRISKFFGGRFDSGIESITVLAGPGVTLIAVGLITILAMWKADGWKKKAIYLLIPLCFGLIIIGEMYGKTVVHHPAPPFFMLKNATADYPKYHVQEQFSYPSGHAARATFLVIISIAFMYQYMKKRANRLRIWLMIAVFVTYVLVISICKIYLGQHWLTDIIGGYLLGTAMAALALYSIP